VLAALCATEVVSWGVLYYAFPVALAAITADTGWPAAATTAAFSAGLAADAGVHGTGDRDHGRVVDDLHDGDGDRVGGQRDAQRLPEGQPGMVQPSHGRCALFMGRDVDRVLGSELVPGLLARSAGVHRASPRVAACNLVPVGGIPSERCPRPRCTSPRPRRGRG